MPLDAKEKKKFFDAAEKNDIKTVKFYVEEENVSLLLLNENSETVAHIAATKGYTDLLKYVASKDSSTLGERDQYGNSVFYMANARGFIDIVKYIIEEHGNIFSNANAFIAAIRTAIEYGHFDIVKYLVGEKNGDVNALNDRRESLVFTAVEYKHHAIVKYLVEEKGADLTTLDTNQANILFPTIATNDLPIIKYFLDERKVPIDVNWQDRFGNTILHRAAIMNRTKIIEYLVEEKRADVNIAGYENTTPLHYAASRNHYTICKYLVEHGANTQYRDDMGQIPIQKTSDKRVIEYMRNAASAIRNRRSVHSVYMPYRYMPPRIANRYPMALPYSSCESAVQPLRRLHSSELQNFLVLAESIIWNAKNLGHFSNSADFQSAPKILQRKIDPMATDATKSLPHFTES